MLVVWKGLYKLALFWRWINRIQEGKTAVLVLCSLESIWGKNNVGFFLTSDTMPFDVLLYFEISVDFPTPARAYHFETSSSTIEGFQMRQLLKLDVPGLFSLQGQSPVFGHRRKNKSQFGKSSLILFNIFPLLLLFNYLYRQTNPLQKACSCRQLCSFEIVQTLIFYTKILLLKFFILTLWVFYVNAFPLPLLQFLQLITMQ